MIFDSTRATNLTAKFLPRPTWERPYSAQFATDPDFARERDYIEGLAQTAPVTVSRRWSASLLSPDDDAFVAGWFEVMLYGWLLPIGPVEVDPPVPGGTPDFKLQLGDQTIFIEAQAHLRTKEERKEDRRVGQIFSIISTLSHPYIIEIRQITVGGPLSSRGFIDAVARWLNTEPGGFLLYEDKSGNRIGLEADPSPSSAPKTYAFRTVGGAVDHTSLKRPLQKKAAKYKHTRRDFPYLIALYLESANYSARDVAAAWFGREQVVIDRNQLAIIETRVDRTGLHFYFDDIRHTTVAGTLVFRHNHDEDLGRRQLSCAYIQNPFSIRTIDTSRLPLRRSLLVASRSVASVEMRWT